MLNLNSRCLGSITYVFLISYFATALLMGCTQERKDPPKPIARRSRIQSVPQKKLPEADIQNLTAVIQTDKGNIEIAFYADEAPKTAKNFAKNARLKFYDGETFHRVEPGKLIQAGSARLTETMPLETNNREYKRGSVAMAGDGGESHTSEFYICLDMLETDEPHTIFGKVIKGFDVIDRIEPNDKIGTVSLVTAE